VIPLGLAARRLATGSWLPAPAMDTGLYLLTQWAAFPLLPLPRLVPLDPASTGTTPGLLAPRRDDGGARAAHGGRGDPGRGPPPGVAGLVVRGGVPGGRPPPLLVDRPLQEMVVDHRAYLGSLGVAFALGLLLHRGSLRLGALVVVVLAGRSVAFQRVLSDPVRAWEHAVARAPDAPDALSALAEAYSERGDPRAEGSSSS